MRGWPKLIVLIVVMPLAFGQSSQPTTAQSSTAVQQPIGQPSSAQQPTKKKSTQPRSVADAARASKQLRESAPPTKVYRNKDVKTNADVIPAGNTHIAATPGTQPGTTPASSRPAALSPDDAFLQKERTFESQGAILRNQVRVQKGKIIDIQNHMVSLKNQFAAWSADFSQDDTAALCWTGQYYLYKDWCDTGRNLKAQYDASQRQLEQEKARLEQMQEAIRRKGYGNAVYDPD
jgi:hypothetical protein